MPRAFNLALGACLLGLTLTLGASDAEADCDHFKWSVAHELALFKQAPEPVDAGAQAALDQAYAVTLKPTENAGFVLPPERAPKAGAYGGVLTIASVAPAGLYEITMSGEAWLDVVQGGVRVKSDNFSGQKDCPGVRKSVRFNLAAGPAVVQISNADSASIDLAVVKAP